MYVCNEVRYGFIPTPLEDTQGIEDDYAQITNLKLEASGTVFGIILRMFKLHQSPFGHLVFFPPMVPHPQLISHVKQPPKDKLGFDEVYLINLERRPERLARMEWAFNELGIDHKLLAATDGK